MCSEQTADHLSPKLSVPESPPACGVPFPQSSFPVSPTCSLEDPPPVPAGSSLSRRVSPVPTESSHSRGVPPISAESPVPAESPVFPQSPVPLESYLSPMASSLFPGALLLHAQSSKEKTFCMVPPSRHIPAPTVLFHTRIPSLFSVIIVGHWACPPR